MQRYVDRLCKLNVDFGEDLAIDMVLHSLPPCYNQFRMTYHMNKEEVTLSKLQGLLRVSESNLKDKSVAPTPNPPVAHVLAIDIKYHFIRHRVEEGHLVVKRVSSEDNPTYPLMKGLSKVKHLQHARSIGLKDDISLD